MAKLAINAGLSVNVSGTKSVNVSPVNKLRSALLGALDMLHFVREQGLDLSAVYNGFDEECMTTIDEYNKAVSTAHQFAPDRFPNGPYIDPEAMRATLCDEQVYREALDRLPSLKVGESMGGPREIGTDHMSFEDMDAVACFRGGADNHPYVWDTKHHHILKDMTVDPGDGRIHLSPQLRQYLSTKTGNDLPLRWPMAKIHLPDLVYHVLEGQPMVDGFTVVPFNQVRRDVRLDNLVYVRGEPKNFRPATPVPEPVELWIGMPFLPRGVTVARLSSPQDVQRGYFEYHARPATSYLRQVRDGDYSSATPPPSSRENIPRKFRVNRENARNVFHTRIVPLLHEANEDFPRNNEKYQRLLKDYYTMWGRSYPQN